MHFHYVLAISLVCMRRNSVDSASGLKTSYKRIKIVAIWQHHKRVFSIFSPRIRRNGYLGTSYQKIWPRHSLRRLRCPIRQMHFQYRVTFTTHMPFYVFCYYVAWPCDLDLWPIVFDIVSCTIPPLSDPHANFNYPTTIVYWVTSTEYLIWFPLSETVIAHAPCQVISNRRQKVHIFEIFDPNLPIQFVTFTALQRRLNHVIGKK